MPYIPTGQRQALDPLIDALAAQLAQQAAEMEQEAALAGLLNYTCTRLALAAVHRRYGRLRYWLIALLTGVFKNITDEFYRRLAAPYEDKQQTQHGDVDVLAEFQRQIDES